MKQKSILIIGVVIIFAMSFMLAACKSESETDVWANALYTENTSFGNGEKSFVLEVRVNDKSVEFTINTDAENLEAALTEHKLIDGDKGPYGMYVKKVNGITADYDVDQSYWALSENDVPLQTGASGVTVEGGEHFEFIYTK